MNIYIYIVCVCVCVCVRESVRVCLSNCPRELHVTRGEFLKRSLTGFISECFFAETGWYTKNKNPNLVYYSTTCD